jgi:hypothetical protein
MESYRRTKVVFMGYLTTLFVSQIMQRPTVDVWGIAKDLEGSDIGLKKVCPRYLLWETEESHENTQDSW